ncbi:stage V sporulation protein AB [Marinicrinis lubricantis]|uniref:Stage V sporulation protein AB n=1 Tax=Marinicrinis lubricantis TaxID=2086470 RepID=A0ABW1ISF3_9BACL
MIHVLHVILVVIVGLSAGLAVGCGFVAFITVLDIIPRMMQILGRQIHIRQLERSVVLGAILWTQIYFYNIHFHFFPMGAGFIGLLQGMFTGMLAAALTEVLNVFPILAKRLRLESVLTWLLMAFVFGKIAGSLFDWFVYQQLS